MKSSAAAQPAKKTRITDEQASIVECNADSLRVNAFAGTGKTTTLVEYALARPNERFLYLAFNKAIQLEGASRFPSNVKCVTSHGLAFPRFGSRYADKLVGSVKINQVMAAFKLPYPEEFQYYFCDVCLKTLNRYLASSAPEISPEMTHGLIVSGTGVNEGDVVEWTKKLWAMMCDTSDERIGMVHDGYLKLYALSEPRLTHDTILFDEAQDANPVTSAIVEAQEARKVLVGDSHQAIYGFRMAYDAMRKFHADKTLYLTKSFRFGQNIADVANLLLSTFKGERKEIVGAAKYLGVVGAMNPREPHTVISRTNSMLFDEAVMALRARRRTHFVGGFNNYRFSDVHDAYKLKVGRGSEIKNPYLRSFKSFDRLESFALAVDDKELKSIIRVVDKYGHDIPRYTRQIEANATQNPSEAAVTLTTAHKSKGLEWDQVRLTDDYGDLVDPKDKDGRPRAVRDEDVNILYVAATRAMKALQPNPELKELVDEAAARKKSSKLPLWARPAVVR